MRTCFCLRDMVKIYSINMPENMPRFCLRSMVNIPPFSPVFPLAEPVAKAFCRLFLWNSKEKSVSHFYGTAIGKRPMNEASISGGGKKRMRFWVRPCQGMWLFYLYNILKIQVLSKFSLRDSMIEVFFGGFLWSFKK